MNVSRSDYANFSCSIDNKELKQRRSERHALTESGLFPLISCDFEQIFGQTVFIRVKLEVLIEKGSAAVSCDANRTKTVCRTVEHTNFFS